MILCIEVIHDTLLISVQYRIQILERAQDEAVHLLRLLFD
jgi:hypothetical protein